MLLYFYKKDPNNYFNNYQCLKMFNNLKKYLNTVQTLIIKLNIWNLICA